MGKERAMRIRAVTIGWTVEWRDGAIANASALAGATELVRRRFSEAGLEPETIRLAIQPFPRVVEPEGVVAFARALADAASRLGFDYVSLGPIRPGELRWIPALLDTLLAQERLFAAVSVTDEGGMLSLPAVEAAGWVIAELARRSGDGFANLRFAALARCPAGVPFFPAAYHDGGSTSLAIAWEAADEAVTAFEGARSLEEAERRLEARLQPLADRVTEIAGAVAAELGFRYLGLDTSLAPFPEERRSIVRAFEALGVAPFGGPGTLAIAAMMTSVVRRLPVPRCGFCGVMLPVLEDVVLGQRAQEGLLDLTSLLVLSAVCGTGLDVVPLPGDTTPAQLAAIVLDVATLAVRLDKPLTARLMPVPGKKADEIVRYDFSFFAPAGVLSVRGTGPAWFGNPGRHERGTPEAE